MAPVLGMRAMPCLAPTRAISARGVQARAMPSLGSMQRVAMPLRSFVKPQVGGKRSRGEQAVRGRPLGL